MHDYDDYDNCPGCGVRDYGYEMSDVRATLTINNCRCKDACVCTDAERTDLGYEPGECICDVNGCECDHPKVKIVIRRVPDRECEVCGGVDFRCVWDVNLDGATVKTFDAEDKADTYVGRVFPTAEPPERDYAWESEAGLRKAEGWG